LIVRHGRAPIARISPLSPKKLIFQYPLQLLAEPVRSVEFAVELMMRRSLNG